MAVLPLPGISADHLGGEMITPTTKGNEFTFSKGRFCKHMIPEMSRGKGRIKEQVFPAGPNYITKWAGAQARAGGERGSDPAWCPRERG